MIISHKHKFIFIKTRKTAGTSIEIALAKYCGEQDVITRTDLEDEEMMRQLSLRSPQNYLLKGCLPNGKNLQFLSHNPAKFIRQQLGEDTWNAYFKFCFERNPWDKVISYYYWKYSRDPRPPLSSFILGGEGGEVCDFELYTIDGEVAVDYIGRYENLERDIIGIYERIGILEKPDLPLAKGYFRKNRQHYSEILGTREKEAIAKTFAREIAYFGYEF